uniref:Uncharacterized protein n=1 Tax=Anguilla anguilla TaxID=7936 RepID=A0A0E9SIG2_ANGAN
MDITMIFIPLFECIIVYTCIATLPLLSMGSLF